AAENRCSRASQFFQDWRQQGIFLHDSQPSLYLYVQRFTVPGTAGPEGAMERERRGIIALGRIEDYSAGVVFRHEQTLAGPKADRLELSRHARAHTGQLFMLYSDPECSVDKLAEEISRLRPAMDVRDEYGVTHRLWVVSDAALITRIQHLLSDKKLMIADGHHRYETAVAYRDECRA